MSDGDKSRADALASDALDPAKLAAVEAAIKQLSPEEAQRFVDILEKAIRRRRIQLAGYLLSLVVLLLGMFAALVYVGRSGEGQFVGWVFLLPLLATGVVLVVFGKWANRIR